MAILKDNFRPKNPREVAKTAGFYTVALIGAAAVGTLSGIFEANTHFLANNAHDFNRFEQLFNQKILGVNMPLEPELPEPVNVAIAAGGGALFGYIGSGLFLGRFGEAAGEVVYETYKRTHTS